MDSLFNLSGKRILITGSNAGIGFALAKGLAEHGATVILNGRNAEKLERAAQQLENFSVETSQFDVTKEVEVKTSIETLTAKAPLDGLINNAGIQRRVSLENAELSIWQEVLETNLSSAFLVSREVAKHMIARGQGKIVNICSLMSDMGRTSTGPYTAAKGGLKMLTKAMCVDWAQHNIQINAIGPGYFITEMTQVLADNPEFDAWVKGRTPAKRWGNPQELVGAAVFLCSSASNFVNGQILYVDGGMISSL